ncbi:MAG: ComF family protein [Gemmatimonadaceae bacterium]
MVRGAAGPTRDAGGAVGLTRAGARPGTRAAALALGRAGSLLLDLLLPRVCAACGRPMRDRDVGVICGRCWSRVDGLPSPQCQRCGHPRLSEGACGWCATLPPFVRAVRSFCSVHTGAGLAIVAALKYDGWTAAADAMAERMARLAWPLDVVEERVALVPVPLAAARARERGYNQSELLARGLARRWAIPLWPGCVERVRGTASQTRLTPGERRRNVCGAFRAAPAAFNFRGAHLVLVDDVVTTGATLNECSAALYDAGARIVSYVTFGRAPALGDRW